MDHFGSILEKVNTASTDNGRCFTEAGRLDNIKAILSDSNYVLIKDDGLSFIYLHKRHEKNRPAILVSCHIDSLYSKYHCSNYNETEILGTFDNSICNAALLCLMMENRIPANVIVAFTGDEESECRGAKETVEYIKDKCDLLWQNLELVIVLDITSVGYDDCPFTIENYFIEENPPANARLLFSSKDLFREYLRKKLSGYEPVKFIGEDADPDETWEYYKFDLNCFTFCFPARPHPDNEKTDTGFWMHNDLGMRIKRESTAKYSDALTLLLRGITDDFSLP
jgi:hypothetical protein